MIARGKIPKDVRGYIRYGYRLGWSFTPLNGKAYHKGLELHRGHALPMRTRSCNTRLRRTTPIPPLLSGASAGPGSPSTGP